MTDREAPKYVRVYYSIINDPRFEHVYHDARTLGTWLQLLLIADAMYPADAPIPGSVNRRCLSVLVDAGLVEVQPHGHFRVHGLASERDKRAHSARNAAAMRWHSSRNAEPMPSRAETSRDEQEQRQAEQTPLPPEEEDAPMDGPAAYYEVTTRFPQHGSALHDWCREVASEYGVALFREALAAEFLADSKVKTLMGRTENRLRAEEAHRSQIERLEERRKVARQHAPMTPPPDAPYDPAEYTAALAAAWEKRFAEKGR